MTIHSGKQWSLVGNEPASYIISGEFAYRPKADHTTRVVLHFTIMGLCLMVQCNPGYTLMPPCGILFDSMLSISCLRLRHCYYFGILAQIDWHREQETKTCDLLIASFGLDELMLRVRSDRSFVVVPAFEKTSARLCPNLR